MIVFVLILVCVVFNFCFVCYSVYDFVVGDCSLIVLKFVIVYYVFLVVVIFGDLFFIKFVVFGWSVSFDF